DKTKGGFMRFDISLFGFVFLAALVSAG
ncbi:MAG: hypothetical protein V7641_1353, partial [Blastocatellia bacterium]